MNEHQIETLITDIERNVDFSVILEERARIVEQLETAYKYLFYIKDPLRIIHTTKAVEAIQFIGYILVMLNLNNQTELVDMGLRYSLNQILKRSCSISTMKLWLTTDGKKMWKRLLMIS